MKIFFTISVLLLVYCSNAQNPQIAFGRTTTTIVQDPDEERIKEVQVIILEECARAIKEGDSQRAVLWYVMTEKLLQPDIVYQYEQTFPITLQMHIDRKTNFENQAKSILFFLKTKRM